jgi:alpha-ribazole phosphatase
MSSPTQGSATQWWWIRHAPVPGAEGCLNGRRDVDCDTSDTAAFLTLAERLPGDAVSVVSPLVRTRQTLDAIIAAGARLPEPLIEPVLVEQSFGDWEGLSWSEMQARDPAAYAAFWSDPTAKAPPGGESFVEQMRRTAEAIERLTARFEGRDIVCVSHGGTIRAAVAHALGLPPQAAMAIVVENLSLTRLSRVSEGFLGAKRAAWLVQTINAPCRWIQPNAPC